MARPPVSALPREMLQQILVKLPTEDIVRCGCVYALWLRVAGDASFRTLHAASHVTNNKDRALLVSEKCGRRRAEASVFDVSSGKPMCGAGIVANPTGYRLANVCGGFLCFAHSHDVTAPVVVCNPVTGEKTELPEAPPLAGGRGARCHLFLLGCSPSTNEYKVFRLSYPDYSSRKKYLGVYSMTTTTGCTHDGIVDVCTLGDGRGWRQHPYLFPHRPVDDGSPPVLVDGMLYVVMCRGDRDKRPDTVLQIDVASELHWSDWTLDLPDFEDPLDDVRVNVFELGGQPCLAVNTVHWCRPKLVFWVTAVDKNGEDYNWHPRYSFYLDANLTGGTLQYDSYGSLPRGAWLDNDGETLCYRVGDTLYKYDTKGCSPRADVGFLSTRDRRRQLQLPAIDQSPSTDRWWNICGSFRPTLLSPLAFALPAQEQFEQFLLRALHSDDNLKRRRRTNCNKRAAKRIC